MSLNFFLAWRFLQGAKSKASISVMIMVCFFSIFVSTGALTLVSAIMQGFEKATHEKLQGTHSDLTLSQLNRPLNFKAIAKILKNKFHDQILAISPSSQAQVLIRTIQAQENQEQESAQLVLLKGINPELEPKVSNLSRMIINPKPTGSNILKDWSELLAVNSLLIGKTLADELRLSIGDSVEVLFTGDEIYSNKITFDSEECKIAGIFKTGIFEFDKHMIISSLELFDKLLGHQDITQISVKLRLKANIEEIKEKISQELPIEVYSWQDFYPALVSALKLEKYAMIFILTLVSIISAMNIISLLYMLIYQKQKQIALLKILGVSNSDIKKIFIIISMLLTSVAALAGITVAAIFSLLLKKYPLITLPDVYYVSHLPAELSLSMVIVVFLGVLFISLLATLIPIRFALAKEKIDLLTGV